MAKFVAVILLVFLCCLSSGESSRKLPASGKNKYYRKFQKVPSARVTAYKLMKNYFGARSHSFYAGKKEDTVILMDGSGSIGQCEFNKGKQALANVIKISNSGGYNAKFACITFASGARRNFNFLSPYAAAARMGRISYPGGWTNTQLALSKARSLFKTRGRRYSRKIVLLVTDGQSNIKKYRTIPNARALKNDGVTIFIVAVGSYINGIDEMVKIASYPPEKHFFRIRKLQNFLQIGYSVMKKVSPGKYKLMKGQTNKPC